MHIYTLVGYDDILVVLCCVTLCLTDIPYIMRSQEQDVVNGVVCSHDYSDIVSLKL